MSMYADREEAEARRSVKERLNVYSSRRPTATGKRQRQDDKWEHDRFDNEPRLSNREVAAHDLRLKLQKKELQPALVSGRPVSIVRNLFEKLSGIASKRPATTAVSKVKKSSEEPTTAKKSAALEASIIPETRSVANPAPRKKNQEDNTESFLESLGLEKYLITFQAEEVDMTILEHITDEDLKAVGLPLGPRKKILLELQSKG